MIKTWSFSAIYRLFTSRRKIIGGSPFTNRFQSMKNVNFPNYPLFYGKNHVSVGCVDFSELLFAQINGTEKDEYLNFAGVDCAVCSIARS